MRKIEIYRPLTMSALYDKNRTMDLIFPSPQFDSPAFRWLELPRIVDARDGVISVAEARKQVPFDIRRVYFIHGLRYRQALRGQHAHRRLEQALFCINGSACIDLDDGCNRFSVQLDRPEIGIYLGRGLWHVMRNFQRNCILLVLASDLFDEADYIRDYDEFRRLFGRP